MERKERVEELLESLWIITVEGQRDKSDFSLLKDDEAVKDLIKMGYVFIKENQLGLTETGKNGSPEMYQAAPFGGEAYDGCVC